MQVYRNRSAGQPCMARLGNDRNLCLRTAVASAVISQFERTDWSGLARDIIGIIDDAKAKQSAFLARRGLTWEQARMLPKHEQEALQSVWASEQ